ncbi:ankyrin repeat-containing domain protein [Hypoxylon argillaceum]|nr:ankyrin repeat-containing domain protein [Hypoxylon argillaceum]
MSVHGPRMSQERLSDPLPILLDAFNEVCSRISSPVFILIDAWDEDNMENLDDFRSVLKTLIASKCKVFLTGRKQPDNSTRLVQPCNQLELGQPNNFDDMKRYIESRLRTMTDLGIYASHPRYGNREYLVESEISDLAVRIVHFSHGMFPFASTYTMGSSTSDLPKRLLKMGFQTYPSRNPDLRSRLKEKPRLSQVRKPTAQILEAIEILEPEEFLQGLILLWLLISSVPISVLAMQLALPILSQRFSLLSTSTVEYKADVVLGPIQALIAIDRGNDLIHLSSNDVIQELTKVWLNKWVQLSPELSFQNVRGQLTICCVQYQLNCGLSAANLKTESDVGRLLRQAPFLAHAATAWNRYYKDFQTLTPPSSLTSKAGITEDGSSSTERDIFNPTLSGSKKYEQVPQPPIDIQKLHEEMMRLIRDLISSDESLVAQLLLSIYLSRESLTTILPWEEESSRIAALPRLHILAELSLVSLVGKINLDDTHLSLDSADEKGATALHIAARIGIEEDVNFLLKGGAKPHAVDSSGKTPIDYAINSGHDAIMARLFEEYCETFYCTDSNDIDIRMIAGRYARYLKIDQGTDSSQLYRALVHAIKHSKAGVVRCFLNLGVDPNGYDEEGIPALHHAIKLTSDRQLEHKDHDIIDLLLRNGADPSAVSNNRSAESGLHVAARLGNIEAARRLVRWDADTRSLDAEGRSVLLAAAEADVEEAKVIHVTRYLLLSGVDVEQADNRGRRVLHIAAEKGYMTIISRLVRVFAAQMDPVAKEGKTPLDYAHGNNQAEAAAMLQIFTGRE